MSEDNLTEITLCLKLADEVQTVLSGIHLPPPLSDLIQDYLLFMTFVPNNAKKHDVLRLINKKVRIDLWALITWVWEHRKCWKLLEKVSPKKLIQTAVEHKGTPILLHFTRYFSRELFNDFKTTIMQGYADSPNWVLCPGYIEREEMQEIVLNLKWVTEEEIEETSSLRDVPQWVKEQYGILQTRNTKGICSMGWS